MSRTPRLHVRITPTALDNADWPALAEFARGHFGTLAAALGLPLEPVIALSERPAEPVRRGPPYVLQIGDRTLRADWTFLAPDGPEGLQIRLQHDLVRNAELLLTEAVAEAVRARWIDLDPRPPVAGLSPPELEQLLRECIRFGTHVDLLAGVAPASEGTDPRWWQLLERGLDAAPSLRIVVATELVTGDPGMLAQVVRDDIHRLTGVILPPIDLPGAPESGAGKLLVGARDVTAIVPLGDSSDAPAERVIAALRPWLPSFVTRETVMAKLEVSAATLPHVVAAVRKRFGEVFITRTLRALVSEGVAISDLGKILGGLLEIREATSADEEHCIVFHAPAGIPPPALALTDGRLDPEDAADCVRRWACRLISTTHWREGTLRVRLLAPALESAFRTGKVEPGSSAHQRFLEALDGTVEPILTNVDIRRRVFDQLAKERPDIAVLSYQELLPETTVVPTQRIDV